MLTKQMQWNPAVHERWAQERLVFWRLGFYPTYRRDDVHEALEAVCARRDIRGRVVYEVFGQHDLLARFWLPPTISPEEVDRDIKRTLTAFHLELCDMFVVDQIVSHWFWKDATDIDSPPPEPAESDIARQPPHQMLREASELVERFNNHDVEQRVVEQNTAAGEYLRSGILGVRVIQPGIKFAVIVSTSGELSSRYAAIEALEEQLTRIVSNSQPIMEKSLYSGAGFGRFLILGKILPENFFSINSDLIKPIVDEASLSGVYRTRSLTYVGASPGLMAFSETLALPAVDEDEEPINVDEILAGGENSRVEFKGSVFVNVNRWMHQGDRHEDAGVADAFVRAVVAMLNSEGGVVVSGVLEADIRDYKELSDQPRTNGLILIGAEFDWADWSRPGWDSFEGRLRQKLNDSVEPAPSQFVSLTNHVVEGRTLCVASVTETSSMWFYVKKAPKQYEFVVREGASSVVLSGPIEESYKRLSPRG
jgi:schlafen family protein